MLATFTGKAYKHHRSADILSNPDVAYNGAGSGSTIFLDFSFMCHELQRIGGSWHYTELDLVDAEIKYSFGSKFMVTLVTGVPSKCDYQPLIMKSGE